MADSTEQDNSPNGTESNGTGVSDDAARDAAMTDSTAEAIVASEEAALAEEDAAAGDGGAVDAGAVDAALSDEPPALVEPVAADAIQDGDSVGRTGADSFTAGPVAADPILDPTAAEVLDADPVTPSPSAPEPVVIEPAVAPVVDTPAAVPPTAALDPAAAVVAPAGAAAPAQPRVVYIETPVPPRQKGNRVVAGLLALLGGLVFGLVYALAVFLLIALGPAEAVRPGTASNVGAAFVQFTASAYFWAPILFFTLGFVLLSLAINRGGWWLYVLFSIAVALFTYFASIGALLLVNRVIFMTDQQASSAYWDLAWDPRLAIAALVAREVAMWMGLASAARGRRVRARNADRRAQFEREVAEKRAEHERVAAATP